MTSQKLVENILKEYPRARHDDRYLMLKVWQVQGLPLTREFIDKFLSKSICSSESIRRTRQKLHEQGRYLPAKEVTIARQALGESMRQTIPKTAEAMRLFE